MLLAAKNRYSLKDENLFLFPNWVDTKFLKPAKGKHQLRAKWGLNEHDVVVMYSGNLGNKQGLDTIPKLAEFFAQNKRIKFVVVGKGSFRETLESAAEELPNLFVFDLLPYDMLPALLNSADIHLVIQRREFSDLVMPSKLTSILSCGANAIVTADPDTELGSIAKIFPGIYKLIEPDNLHALTNAISDMTCDTQLAKHNELARAYAENHLEKEIVLSTFVSDVEEFLESQ